MHNEYRIYGRSRASIARGCVASNLIAAFVTGADGNSEAAVKVCSIRLNLIPVCQNFARVLFGSI